MAKKKNDVFDPRPYMQIAIEEMKKCIPEPRPDKKIPPFVGAVLLFPDGKTVRAHRSELRHGDHAEYTLLERKLGDQKLEECILFSTLEPCVKRSSPKIGCSKRTINAKIKHVYVGIQDRDPTVSGQGIKLIEKSGAKVEMFDSDLQEVIRAWNEDYLKQAGIRAKKEKEERENPMVKAEPKVNFEDFSDEALTKFIKESGKDFKLTSEKFKQFLWNSGAVDFNEETNTYKPSQIGYVLFGKDPRSVYPQAVLKASINYGDDHVESQDFDQPLVLVPELVEKWLKKVLPLSKDTSSFKRQDNPIFPVEPIREAIINALAHRNYDIKEAKCYLEIDNEKIIVRSPGEPLPSITLEKLNTFKAPSLSRNYPITYILSLMDLMEEKMFGMKEFREMRSKYNLPLPFYQFDEPFLTLTFPRSTKADKEIYPLESFAELNEEELAGYEFIKVSGFISKKEYAVHFGYNDKKAYRQLAKMKELGLITSKGASTATRYFVNPDIM